MPLIFSHFSPRNPVCSQKFSPIGRAVDPAAAPSKAASTMFPLLNHDHPHLFEFRSHYDGPINKEYGSKTLPSGTNFVSVAADRGGSLTWRGDIACISVLTSSGFISTPWRFRKGHSRRFVQGYFSRYRGDLMCLKKSVLPCCLLHILHYFSEIGKIGKFTLPL
jgi:hypothetical protein